MGKTKRRTCEEVLQECERQLRTNRCPLKELRREIRQVRKNFEGIVDWEELDNA